MTRFLFNPNALAPWLLSLTALGLLASQFFQERAWPVTLICATALIALSSFFFLIPWYGSSYDHSYGIRGHFSKSHLINLYAFHFAFALQFFPILYWLMLPFFGFALFFQYVSFAMIYFHFVIDSGKKIPNFLTRS